MARKLFFIVRLGAMPILVALGAWIEVQHSPSYFRALTFVLVFLLLADIASLSRGARRDYLLALTSLAFGLCLIEAAVTLSEVRQLVITTNGWSVRRPVIGWGPERPGRFHSEKADPKTGATIYSVDYSIDSNLLRQTQSSDADAAMVFFGDSVTFGIGVNDADTLPQSFADSLARKERILNLAFPGYGPQQFLRELQTGLFDPVIGAKPKLFVFTTAAWHAERTSCKASWMLNAPRYVLENGQVAFKGGCFEGTSLQLQEWLGNTALHRLIFARSNENISHNDIELYVRILLAAVNLAKEKYGVPTLIPYLQAPDGYLAKTGFSDGSIIKRLRDGGAVVIDASLLKEAADGALIGIPGDGHPTPLANRLRASMLKDYIENHMSGILVSRLK